jgi:hypothetical protein
VEKKFLQAIGIATFVQYFATRISRVVQSVHEKPLCTFRGHIGALNIFEGTWFNCVWTVAVNEQDVSAIVIARNSNCAWRRVGGEVT